MDLSTSQLPVSDLDYIVKRTEALWENLRNQSLLITGGTGFFGCWLLESFVWANRKLDLNASVVVLTRNPEHFAKKCPYLFSEPSILFYQGDVRDFKFPTRKFSYLIHAATEAASNLNKTNPKLMLETIIQGTTRTLEFARQTGVQNFLLVSSGAIYGKQPSTLSHLTEDYQFSDRDADDSAYAWGKRKAEDICAQYAERYDLTIKIARCFAFVGPYLPLDAHFALGNFIRDGLNQRPIVVHGDGSPYRSYLYAGDLAVFLWTILFSGQTMRPYNVGSEEALTIKELAQRVANNFASGREVHIKKVPTNQLPERYVPDITRAKKELGLIPGIDLEQSIRATINWYQQSEIKNDTN